MKIGERGSFTKGIPYVLVSGQVVIDKGAEAKLAIDRVADWFKEKLNLE